MLSRLKERFIPTRKLLTPDGSLVTTNTQQIDKISDQLRMPLRPDARHVLKRKSLNLDQIVYVPEGMPILYRYQYKFESGGQWQDGFNAGGWRQVPDIVIPLSDLDIELIPMHIFQIQVDDGLFTVGVQNESSDDTLKDEMVINYKKLILFAISKNINKFEDWGEFLEK